MTYIYERVFDLLDIYYKKTRRIMDETIIMKTKDGFHIVKSQISAAEKFDVRDASGKISIDLCERQYLKPERIELARAIFNQTKSIYSSIMRKDPEQCRYIAGYFDRYELNQGFEEFLKEKTDQVVSMCEDVLLQLGIDTIYKYQDYNEVRDEEGSKVGMQLKPEEKKDIVAEEFADLYEQGEGES
jgi:hypothetical protein